MAQNEEKEDNKAIESEFISKLTWPLQVLEVLAYNGEQASLGIRKAKMVDVIGRVLAILEEDGNNRVLVKETAP